MRSDQGATAFDLRSALDWWEGLPYPDWESVGSRIGGLEGDDAAEAWTAAAREWLSLLGDSFDGEYVAQESAHFLALVHRGLEGGDSLLKFAEHCRSALLTGLPGVTTFRPPGKDVLIVAESPGEYYRYTSRFYPEGVHGGSGGVHIRAGHPHIVTYGRNRRIFDVTIAHEMTHAALHHLALPAWLEEGLAQMFEQDVTGLGTFKLDAKQADRHKRYWGKHGLDAFWTGAGFRAPNKLQELSYQLAETLVRLLASDARPRWFGFVQQPRRKFLSFLGTAKWYDCGEGAAVEHLGISLAALAERFLGPGEWSPPSKVEDESVP